MGIITKPTTFGLLNCIGCDHPLKKYNKHYYHNRKCLAKFFKRLDAKILKALLNGRER